MGQGHQDPQDLPPEVAKAGEQLKQIEQLAQELIRAEAAVENFQAYHFQRSCSNAMYASSGEAERNRQAIEGAQVQYDEVATALQTALDNLDGAAAIRYILSTGTEEERKEFLTQLGKAFSKERRN